MIRCFVIRCLVLGLEFTCVVLSAPIGIWVLQRLWNAVDSFSFLNYLSDRDVILTEAILFRTPSTITEDILWQSVFDKIF